MLSAYDLIMLTDEQKQAGVWLSGIEGEGECKIWHSNGQLMEHSNWKNGKEEGECKIWHSNGQLWEHSNWKNGKEEGECKRWYFNGQLMEHSNYKNGKKIKDYLK